MASHKSAIKKQKQDRVRRARNRAHMSKLRTDLKKIRALIRQGDSEQASHSVRKAESVLDHAASLGVIHPNAAARTKSRLVRQVNGLGRG